jgi:hypothetical protein
MNWKGYGRNQSSNFFTAFSRRDRKPYTISFAIAALQAGV